MNDSEKFIVPPRLNKKALLYGFTYAEIIITLAMVIGSAIFRLFVILPIAALYFCTSFRGLGERNARDYILLLYRYYLKPQNYTLREEIKNEN